MEDTTKLYGAIVRGDSETAISLLHNDPTLEYKFVVVGKAPIHLASQRNLCDVLRFLLDSGVDVDLLTEDGASSALDIAAGQGCVEASLLLLERGADVNRGFGTKATPIFSAIYGQSLDVVKAIIEHGADLGATFGSGQNVHAYANQYGTQEIRNLLRAPNRTLGIRGNR